MAMGLCREAGVSVAALAKRSGSVIVITYYTQLPWLLSRTHQLIRQVLVVVQSPPEFLQMIHELVEICVCIHLVQQRSIALHSIMETGHPVHINVILSR